VKAGILSDSHDHRAAVAAALSRSAGMMITLSDVQISGDIIRARARLKTAAGNGSNP